MKKNTLKFHPGPEAEILAHFSMLLNEHPARVLVIGGGVGGLLRELLRHPVDEIAYAEQDPLLIETLRRFPNPLTAQELTHPKFGSIRSRGGSSCGSETSDGTSSCSTSRLP